MTKAADKIMIQADPREVFGKKTKKLRRSKILPANIFGQGKPSLAVSLKLNQFWKLFNKHGGDLGLVYIKMNEKTEPVLVTEVSKDPVTDELIHVEFMRVDLKKEVETVVPLEVVGEASVPNTVLEVIRDEVKIRALPEDIPEKIDVDVSGLTEAGQIITIADLVYDREKISLLVDESEMTKPVVILQEVKEEVEPEEEAPSSTDDNEAAATSNQTDQNQEEQKDKTDSNQTKAAES